MSPLPDSAAYCGDADTALQEVADWFRARKNHEDMFRQALRTAVDEVLDGRRTGRYSIKKLHKTEKIYIGTKAEIVVQDVFTIQRGAPKKPDYLIRGHEVDCKFTIRNTWTIPREAVGKICLLLQVNEEEEHFSAGLLRTMPHFLTNRDNQDKKRQVSAAGKEHILWLAQEASFPKTLLLGLPDMEIKSIFKDGSSGQERINTLLERVQGIIIDSETLDTVAQQRDGNARVREGDGRARTVLREHGILVAGHWKTHTDILAKLAVPLPRMPKTGEFVSFRVVRAGAGHASRPSVTLDGEEWVLASDDDPREPGPRLPETGKGSA
jgi:hypothetical protein